MTTMTLVEFLTARLDEDEREHGKPYAMESWHANTCDVVQDPERSGGCDCGVPARVLREVAAKRAIVAEHQDGNRGQWIDPAHPEHKLAAYCERCEISYGPAPWPCPTLRAVINVYAHHPDYDQDWRS